MHERSRFSRMIDDCRECSRVENQSQEDKEKSVEREVNKKMLDIKSEQK